MSNKKKLTPKELAAMWGIHATKVIAWIRSGELRAMDASQKPGGKPRYRIDIADIEAFERARQITPSPKPTPPKRRRLERVTKFF